ncbi:MAG: hypothetical protein M3Y28_00105 [Armatimonadota bacterium]|nr:hypothetical protein [Armatimonadota bacterium]
MKVLGAFILIIALVQHLSTGICQADGNGTALGAVSTKVGHSLDLTPYLIDGYDSKFVGVVDDQQFVTVKTTGSLISRIDFWNIRSGKLEKQIQPPEPVLSWSALLSPNGRMMTTAQNNLATILHHSPNKNSHKIFQWDTDTHRLIRTLDVGPEKDILGSFFLPQVNELLLSIHAGSSQDVIYRYVDTHSGKTLKEVETPQMIALDAASAVVSPDGKLVVAIEESAEGDAGALSVLDAANGKVVQTFTGNFRVRPIAPPYFFLSQKEFVCGRLIYDIKVHRTIPLFRPHDPRRKAVAGLPRHPGYAFFLTDKGLELWNVPGDRMAYRWTEIHQADDIYFSPSMHLMCVFKHQKLQFWTFAPKLIGR